MADVASSNLATPTININELNIRSGAIHVLGAAIGNVRKNNAYERRLREMVNVSSLNQRPLCFFSIRAVASR